MNKIDLLPKKAPIEPNKTSGIIIQWGAVAGLIAWGLSGVGWGFGIGLGLMILCITLLLTQLNQFKRLEKGEISAPTEQMYLVGCFAIIVFMWQLAGIVVLCAKWLH